MKAIILEDELIASRRLERMIEEVNPDVQVIRTFETIEDISEYLNAHEHPDVLFLDIHVADGNSFELLRTIDIKSKVVFVTAFDEYAVEAFRKNAIDYLLKPIKIDELREAISRVKASPRISAEAIERLSPETSSNRFLIRFGAKLYVVKHEDIAYVYSENKISYFIQHDGKKVPSDLRMQDILDTLNPDLFFRLNRQCIANINAVGDILSYSKSRLRVKLIPPLNEDLVVSTETTPDFKLWLGGKLY